MPFYLVQKQDIAYISSPSLCVRVEVYDLDEQDIVVRPGIMDFYHSHAGKTYAFLADVSGASFEDITDALMWYAEYKRWPAANFQMRDPRIIQ